MPVGSLAAPILVLLAVTLDLFGVPVLDVGRQVPQAWGHRHGPMAAATRYGLRLGVAPSTILSTWLWWAGFVAASLGSWGLAVIGAAIFAFARFLTMVAVAGGTHDGVAMARRMGRWRALERPIRGIGLGMLAAIAAASLATTLAS